jgi:hypothetical protein
MRENSVKIMIFFVERVNIGAFMNYFIHHTAGTGEDITTVPEPGKALLHH